MNFSVRKHRLGHLERASCPRQTYKIRTIRKMTVIPAMDVDKASQPPRKRLRQESSTDAPAKAARGPRLFVPFRALGLITNHIPFVLQTRSHKGATDGPKIHLLTCLGKSWALWEGGKMTLLFVGMYVGHIVNMSVCDSQRSLFRS